MLYQKRGDEFLGPCDAITLCDDSVEIDVEGKLAAITDVVPRGADRLVAASSIRLLMLVNDVCLRSLVPSELAKGSVDSSSNFEARRPRPSRV